MDQNPVAERRIVAAVVDDHEVVAAGLKTWCANATPPIAVLALGTDVGALWVGRGRDVDVVIFDLQLTQSHQEFGQLRRLTESRRRVVVYSQASDTATALQCIDFGALAYVTKREGKDHLVAAIHAAARGEPYTPPSLSGAMAADTRSHRPRLTEQETATLRAWFASSSKRLAAQVLNISPKTLETYLDRARTKYANVGRPAPTKSDLVARALEDGIITLDELNEGSSSPE